MAPVYQLGEVSWLVVCTACCHISLVFAVMHLYNIFYFLLLLSIPFLYFLKSGIYKLTEWSTVPARPSLMCFFNKGGTKGANSSKILCSMFVYVLFYVNLSGLVCGHVQR